MVFLVTSFLELTSDVFSIVFATLPSGFFCFPKTLDPVGFVCDDSIGKISSVSSRISGKESGLTLLVSVSSLLGGSSWPDPGMTSVLDSSSCSVPSSSTTFRTRTVLTVTYTLRTTTVLTMRPRLSRTRSVTGSTLTAGTSRELTSSYWSRSSSVPSSCRMKRSTWRLSISSTSSSTGFSGSASVSSLGL